MTAFITNCGFIPTLGGTTDWTFSAAVTGYQSPTNARAVDQETYVIRAQSADNSQWEYALCKYTLSTGVFARLSVLYNSSGTGTRQSGAGTKINFTAAPAICAVVAIGEQLTAVHNIKPRGRLTLTSGVFITKADVAAATSVYYTPGEGDFVPLYDGFVWYAVKFSEVSLALTGLAINTNHDIFGSPSGGSLALSATAWTSDTVRATAIAQQDGLDVMSGTPTKLLLGTIRITGTAGQTEDSVAKRYVSNRYNDVPRPMQVTDPATVWAYGTASFRQANGNAANQLDYVSCVDRPVWAYVQSTINHSTSSGPSNAIVGIGVDVVAAASNSVVNSPANVTSTASFPASAYYQGTPGIGRHTLKWLEYGSQGAGSALQWFGTLLPTAQSGIFGGVSN